MRTWDSNVTMSVDPAPEKILIQQAIQGSIEAFEQLIRQYQKSVFHFFYARLSFAEAQDLTQQTFLLVYRNLAKFNNDQPFKPWLFTIVRNLFVSYLRKARKVNLTHQIPEDLSSSNQSEQFKQDYSFLWQLARQILSEEQYSTLWLHYYERMSVETIASILSRSPTHIKVILHRARKKLAESVMFRRSFPTL